MYFQKIASDPDEGVETMSEKIYARVVVGEIVVECEAPKQYSGNAAEAVAMMKACAEKAERILIEQLKPVRSEGKAD